MMNAKMPCCESARFREISFFLNRVHLLRHPPAHTSMQILLAEYHPNACACAQATYRDKLTPDGDVVPFKLAHEHGNGRLCHGVVTSAQHAHAACRAHESLPSRKFLSSSQPCRTPQRDRMRPGRHGQVVKSQILCSLSIDQSQERRTRGSLLESVLCNKLLAGKTMSDWRNGGHVQS